MQIAKFLAEHKINSKITIDKIIILDELTEEIAQGLSDKAEIITIANDDSVNILTETSEPKVLFPTVKRGEVYLCDFGKPYGSEQAGLRPCIIVQNDQGNEYSSTTIVLPCSTKNKPIPTHYVFNFTKDIMPNIDNSYFFRKNSVRAEQIRVIDKTRLTRFLGTLTDKFMLEHIQPIILKALAINPEIYTTTSTPELKHTDLKEAQIALLASVDIVKLLEVSKKSINIEQKINQILLEFKFDLHKNGINYLCEAIKIASQLNPNSYTIQTLSNKVAKILNVPEQEVERLIIARIKEQFKAKKSPAIEFIRLVSTLLTQHGGKSHENNHNL